MGGSQSNQAPNEGQWTSNTMTFDQLLDAVSQKVGELQEVLGNMKKDRRKRERVPECQAKPILMDTLVNAEDELRRLNISLSQVANQQGQARQQYPQQQPNQARKQYPQQQPNQAGQQYPQQQPNQARQQYPQQQPSQVRQQYPQQLPSQGRQQYPQQQPSQTRQQYHQEQTSQTRQQFTQQQRSQEKLRHPEQHDVPTEHHTGTPRETGSLYAGAPQTQPKYSKAEMSSTPTHKTMEEFSKENIVLKITVDTLAKRNGEIKKEAQKLRDENENLFHRLSKLTSDKLTADNPNIADLSDDNRPTKLVETMSELYDNQWTDAFVALQPLKNNDKLVVKILLHTFMDIYEFCKDKSRSLVSMTEKTMKDIFEDVNAMMKKRDHMVKPKSATILCRADGKEMAGLIRQQSFDESNTIFLDWQGEKNGKELEESGSFKDAKDVWPKVEGELKKARKCFGVAMVPIVTKAYLKPRWSKSCVKELKPYIRRCFYVAWMMCVQTPPMALAAIPRQDEVFDVNLYSAYSKRGNKVDFVVWPAVLLEEQQFGKSAAVMRKGVANGKD